MLLICLELKPHKAIEVTVKPYLVGLVTPQFEKFDGRSGNTREHVVHFLNSIGAHAKDADLCMIEFSKSLTDKAYISCFSLKQ